MMLKKLGLVSLLLILVGCASTPPTSIHQPMTARPLPPDARQANNGSIFQAATAQPLFEDQRARFVGDTLTVTITENSQASAQSSSNVSRTASTSANINALNVFPFNKKPLTSMSGLNIDAGSDNSFSGSGDTASNNVFTGTITVTVIEVYPNGNLLVSGEKQVSIGHQQEFIRLSGVVNPRDIVTSTHSVPSSKVADARIEYKASGYISEAQVMGWLARFFLSVLPF